MPAEAPSIDVLGLALVVIACLALLVTLGSLRRPGGARTGATHQGDADSVGEPVAVIPESTFQGATDRRIRELETRLDLVEGELRRINYELSKR